MKRVDQGALDVKSGRIDILFINADPAAELAAKEGLKVALVTGDTVAGAQAIAVQERQRRTAREKSTLPWPAWSKTAPFSSSSRNGNSVNRFTMIELGRVHLPNSVALHDLLHDFCPRIGLLFKYLLLDWASPWGFGDCYLAGFHFRGAARHPARLWRLFLSRFAAIYSTVVRSIPVIVIIFILYFVIASAVDLSPFLSGALALWYSPARLINRRYFAAPLFRCRPGR